MALKPCKECGRDVSTSARKCPHCGVAFPTGRPFFDFDAGANLKQCGCLLLALLAVLLVFGIGPCALLL